MLAATILAFGAVPAGSAQAWISLADTGLRAVAPIRVAPEPQPLTGAGKNMELVANVPMAGDSSHPAASDIELAGDYAYVGSYGEGVVIVDISDPTHPKRTGVFNCPGGQNDVQLSDDARYAVMAIDTKNNGCHNGKEGSVVLDVSDKAKPREVAFIPIEVGSHNDTLDWPYLYVDNYPTSYHRLEVFSLATPSAPKKIGELNFGEDTDGIHDSYVDHRPDGKSLLYAASIGHTDVIDIADPSKPKLALRFADPRVSISHQAEPNFDRSMLLVTDEFLGGGSAPTCGQIGNVRLPGLSLPYVGDPTDIGALHIYALNPDGSVKGNGSDGWVNSINLPVTVGLKDAGCTIHVLWQAPDENRFVAAWYGRGTHIFDFSDPASPKEIGSYVPTDSDTWSAKPHRGYIFTGDIVRGMDVLRYTGEDGKRWPATAGDAAIQRARGDLGKINPSSPKPAPPRKTGTFRFSRRVNVPLGSSRPGARTPLTATFSTIKGKVVARLRFHARAGRVARLTASTGGLAGKYRYTIRRGTKGKAFARGTFTVKGSSKSKVGLKPGQTLVCRVQAE